MCKSRTMSEQIAPCRHMVSLGYTRTPADDHPHVAETDSEVTLEFELPFWIEEDDVQVDISSAQLSVTVRNELSFQRSYWRNRHVTSFMHILQLPMCAALQSVIRHEHRGSCQPSTVLTFSDHLWCLTVARKSETPTTLWWTSLRACVRWTLSAMLPARKCSC